MSDRLRRDRIERMTCDACGAWMNPHAEKPIVPAGGAGLPDVGSPAGEVVEEIHQCPACGRTQTRRAS